MSNDGSNTTTPRGLIARLGELLMVLVAGKDLRVRRVIARTAAHARSSRDLQLNTQWHTRHDPVAAPRVE
ncbi:MAG: hypothetical protein ACLQDM_17375 [Bradyrhizobium sp.]